MSTLRLSGLSLDFARDDPSPSIELRALSLSKGSGRGCAAEWVNSKESLITQIFRNSRTFSEILTKNVVYYLIIFAKEEFSCKF